MREYKRVRGFVVNKRSGHPSYADKIVAIDETA